jgi:hypothetical protein
VDREGPFSKEFCSADRPSQPICTFPSGTSKYRHTSCRIAKMEYKPVSSLLYNDCASGLPGHMAHPEIMCSVSSVPIVHAAVPKDPYRSRH